MVMRKIPNEESTIQRVLFKIPNEESTIQLLNSQIMIVFKRKHPESM